MKSDHPAGVGRMTAAALLLSLAGCATRPAPEPSLQVQKTDIATPVSCVPADTPQRPTFSDTSEALKAAPDLAARYQLFASEHLRHFASETLAWDIVEACRKAAPAPPLPK